jgi:pimeloyl-ACP methyl ester carboxylesterase
MLNGIGSPKELPRQLQRRRCDCWAVVIALAVGAVVGTSGCVSAVQRFERNASHAGLIRTEVEGAGFTHLIYQRPATGQSLAASHPVLVYLEGDGIPGTGRGTEPSLDPTPLTPLALRLMLRSPERGWYLTRPCYNGMHSPRCKPELWVQARYSSAVVDSMVAALLRHWREAGRPPLILVGYSGGGALAVLMASRPDLRSVDIRGVVTIAANLDTDAWTQTHGYLPLDASLNPAQTAELAVPTIHLVGEQDIDVPPHTLSAYIAAHPHALVWRYAAFDHRCCWVEEWPQLLARARSEIEGVRR